MTRKFLAAYVAGTIAACGLLLAVVYVGSSYLPLDPPPPYHLMGWSPEGMEEAYQRNAPALGTFAIDGGAFGAEDNADRRVVLWDAARACNNGEHLPTLQQLIGDCVGFGSGNALRYLEAVHLILYEDDIVWREPFIPFHYATGRNAPEAGNGRLGRNPNGSFGSDQAAALVSRGWVAADEPGLPKYSKSVAESWAVKMPDPHWLAIGKQHLVKTAARVRTAAEIRDAICNGYPVTIASTWGGKMRPPTVDGRLVNSRVTRWGHQMCVIGYDGSLVRERYFYVLNSWGPDAHGTPPDDAPPGGFWIRLEDMEWIARTGECYAFSDIVGYERRDWSIVARRSEMLEQARTVERLPEGHWRRRVCMGLADRQADPIEGN